MNFATQLICLIVYEDPTKVRRTATVYGAVQEKIGLLQFFQVFKFNSFWIQDCALSKTVLTHSKLDSVSKSYKALNF